MRSRLDTPGLYGDPGRNAGGGEKQRPPGGDGHLHQQLAQGYGPLVRHFGQIDRLSEFEGRCRAPVLCFHCRYLESLHSLLQAFCSPPHFFKRPASTRRGKCTAARYAPCFFDEPPVYVLVPVCHGCGGKPPPGMQETSLAVYAADISNSSGHLISIGYDDTGYPAVDNLGNRTVRPGNDRSPAGHCLNHHQSERLGPVD